MAHPISFGFIPKTTDPIDSRLIITAGNPYDHTNNVPDHIDTYTLYEGMQVYSEGERKLWIYTNDDTSDSQIIQESNWLDITAHGGNPTALDTNLADVLSITDGEISAVDNGSDAVVGWDDSANELTYLSAADAQVAINVDPAGTDNSTDVTLVTTNHDYLSISDQAITLGPIDLSNAADVTGQLPAANLTGVNTWRTIDFQTSNGGQIATAPDLVASGQNNTLTIREGGNIEISSDADANYFQIDYNINDALSIDTDAGDTSLFLNQRGTFTAAPDDSIEWYDSDNSTEFSGITRIIEGNNITFTQGSGDSANELTISSAGGGNAATSLNDLSDVALASLASGDFLRYNGTNFVNLDADSAGLVAKTGDQTGIGGVKTWTDRGLFEADAAALRTDLDGQATIGNFIFEGNTTVSYVPISGTDIQILNSASPGAVTEYVNLLTVATSLYSFTQSHSFLGTGSWSTLVQVLFRGDDTKERLFGTDPLAVGDKSWVYLYNEEGSLIYMELTVNNVGDANNFNSATVDIIHSEGNGITGTIAISSVQTDPADSDVYPDGVDEDNDNDYQYAKLIGKSERTGNRNREGLLEISVANYDDNASKSTNKLVATFDGDGVQLHDLDAGVVKSDANGNLSSSDVVVADIDGSEGTNNQVLTTDGTNVSWEDNTSANNPTITFTTSGTGFASPSNVTMTLNQSGDQTITHSLDTDLQNWANHLSNNNGEFYESSSSEFNFSALSTSNTNFALNLRGDQNTDGGLDVVIDSKNAEGASIAKIEFSDDATDSASENGRIDLRVAAGDGANYPTSQFTIDENRLETNIPFKFRGYGGTPNLPSSSEVGDTAVVTNASEDKLYISDGSNWRAVADWFNDSNRNNYYWTNDGQGGGGWVEPSIFNVSEWNANNGSFDLTYQSQSTIGPNLELYHDKIDASEDPVAGADGDVLAHIEFLGHDNASTPNKIAYAEIDGEIINPDSNNPEGELNIRVNYHDGDNNLTSALHVRGDQSRFDSGLRIRNNVDAVQKSLQVEHDGDERFNIQDGRIEALVPFKVHTSTTDPSDTTVGNIFYDTTSGSEALKIYDGTDYVEVGGSGGGGTSYTFEDEGTALASQNNVDKINFVGSGVIASVNSDGETLDVSISSGSFDGNLTNNNLVLDSTNSNPDGDITNNSIIFRANNDADEDVDYSKFILHVEDDDDTAEYGSLKLRTINEGAEVDTFHFGRVIDINGDNVSQNISFDDIVIEDSDPTLVFTDTDTYTSSDNSGDLADVRFQGYKINDDPATDDQSTYATIDVNVVDADASDYTGQMVLQVAEDGALTDYVDINGDTELVSINKNTTVTLNSTPAFLIQDSSNNDLVSVRERTFDVGGSNVTDNVLEIDHDTHIHILGETSTELHGHTIQWMSGDYSDQLDPVLERGFLSIAQWHGWTAWDPSNTQHPLPEIYFNINQLNNTSDYERQFRIYIDGDDGAQNVPPFAAQSSTIFDLDVSVKDSSGSGGNTAKTRVQFKSDYEGDSRTFIEVEEEMTFGIPTHIEGVNSDSDALLTIYDTTTYSSNTDDNLGTIHFTGNSNGNVSQHQYAGIRAKALDTTNGGEDGELQFLTSEGGGNLASRLNINGTIQSEALFEFWHRTTDQRDTLGDVEGSVIYNTTNNRLEINDGSNWQTLNAVTYADVTVGGKVGTSGTITETVNGTEYDLAYIEYIMADAATEALSTKYYRVFTDGDDYTYSEEIRTTTDPNGDVIAQKW